MSKEKKIEKEEFKETPKKEKYYPFEIYLEERDSLLIEQKGNLYDRMEEIYYRLSKKNNIDEFLEEEEEEDEEDENEQSKKKCDKLYLFLKIKVIGGALFIMHLFSIYQINSIIIAIGEELIATIKSYLKNIDREPTDDFYQNFNKLNNKLPDYSPFFITSALYEFLNGYINYVILTYITATINALILGFGFSKYEFNLDRKNYKNYTLNQFFYLFLIYLILCISQGVISLYP